MINEKEKENNHTYKGNNKNKNYNVEGKTINTVISLVSRSDNNINMKVE